MGRIIVVGNGSYRISRYKIEQLIQRRKKGVVSLHYKEVGELILTGEKGIFSAEGMNGHKSIRSSNIKAIISDIIKK